MTNSIYDEVAEVELEKIRPNRLNPRLSINSETLNQLVSSIEQTGLLQPLLVRRVNDEYEVVIGERRYRAAQKVGLKKVPVIIRKYTDDEVIELNLVENVQREDLSAVEKGNCSKQLMKEYPERYPNIEAVAKKIGTSSPSFLLIIFITPSPPIHGAKYVVHQHGISLIWLLLWRKKHKGGIKI